MNTSKHLISRVQSSLLFIKFKGELKSVSEPIKIGDTYIKGCSDMDFELNPETKEITMVLSDFSKIPKSVQKSFVLENYDEVEKFIEIRQCRGINQTKKKGLRCERMIRFEKGAKARNFNLGYCYQHDPK